MKSLMLPLLAGFLLASCQSPQDAISPSDHGAAREVARTRHTQYTLWGDNILNARAPMTLPAIAANSTRLSLDWDGDAVELLAQLARQRGLTFNYSGVRLPLPLNLHVRDMTFQNLLRLIEAQTQWRATLSQHPGELQLLFLPYFGKEAAA